MKPLLIEKAQPVLTVGPCDVSIAICGAGALGGNLARALAHRGFRRLRIIDRDWVEEQDLANQPFQPRDIGTPKARTLAGSLFNLAGVEADPQTVELTKANAAALLVGSELVVDALDNPTGRHAVAEACARLGLPCLHLVAGGDEGLAFWDDDQSLRDSDSREDCLLPKTLADLVIDAGCESIERFLLTGEKRSKRTAGSLGVHPAK